MGGCFCGVIFSIKAFLKHSIVNGRKGAPLIDIAISNLILLILLMSLILVRVNHPVVIASLLVAISLRRALLLGKLFVR